MNNEVYSVGDGGIITLVVRETIYNLRIPSPVVSQKGRKAGDQQIVFLIGTHSRKDDSGSILDLEHVVLPQRVPFYSLQNEDYQTNAYSTSQMYFNHQKHSFNQYVG